MKKGFTLIELLAVIVVIAIVFVIAIPIVLNAVGDVNKQAFLSSELAIKEAASNYVFHNLDVMPNNIGEVYTLQISDLVSQKYIDNIDDCGGYINIVKKNDNDYSIIPYLKCGVEKNVSNANDDKLIVHYTFDDFQEPTVNLINGSSIGGHGSAYNLQDFSFNGGEVYRNYVTSPNVGNNFGFRSSTHRILDSSGKKSLTISFDNRVDISPDFLTGYARVKYTDLTETNHSWNYNPSNWFNKDETGFKKVTGTTTLTSGKVPELVTIWYVYRDYAQQGDMLVSNIQLEQKPYSTPYVKDSRDGTVHDYSGKNINANLALATTPRWIDESYYFDGINTSISLPNNILSTNDIRTNGLTYSVWIKPEQLTEQRVIGQQISPGYSDYSNGGIGINSLGKAVMIAYSDANPSSYIFESSDTTLDTTKWNHVVGVYDNVLNQLRIYVNGKLDSSPSTIGTFSRLLSVENNRIGKKEGSLTYNYKGHLDDVRIYNRVLSDLEIEKIYNYEIKNRG